MRKKLVILGSTGSIGCQTIKVVNEYMKDNIEIVGLSAYDETDIIIGQHEMLPAAAVALIDKNAGTIVKSKLNGVSGRIFSGQEANIELLEHTQPDIVLNAIVGVAGLKPTLAALRSGCTVALANKETLVAGGRIVMEEAKNRNLNILPVDSEHSAIFQCLQRSGKIEKIILTASGGPFFGSSKDDLMKIGPEQALAHPNWSMGAKISVDSATLFNKGLEVIEAHWLFDVPYKQIEVIVHRESIIHSMVQYSDGCVMGQMGLPDMALPIQYALAWPDDAGNDLPRMDFAEIGKLSFYKPDMEVFHGLALAYECGEKGGCWPAVMNAANEEAVALFLNGSIRFLQITEIVERVLSGYSGDFFDDLDGICASDLWARQKVQEIKRGINI